MPIDEPPNDAHYAARPPQLSKLLLLLGAISLVPPFCVDGYLPALPAIAANLHGSARAVQFTLPAFFIGLSLSQLVFGSLADHYGRRPPLLWGLALVCIGSVGCALAPSVPALTIWRSVQACGVGSAGVIPRAVIRDRFSIGHMARALSLLGLLTGLGPIIAPQLGGLILLIGSWRIIFWGLAVMSLGCFAAAYLKLEESIPDVRHPAIGPKLWFALLTDRRFVRFALPAVLVQASAFAYISGASFVYIDHLHLTPQQFSWMFGANAVGLIVVGRINAHIVLRLGPELIFRRAMLWTAALGMLLAVTSFSGWGGFWGLAVPQLLMIATLGFNFSNGFALTLAPFGSAAGTASALFGTLQFMIAGLVGAAVSWLYDGTSHAMAAVMCGSVLSAVVLYRLMARPHAASATV